MNKRIINIIGVFFIFLISFVVHNIYEIFPLKITMIFFPINESIFEHIKMIFTSYMIWIVIKSIIIRKNKIVFNNYLFLELVSLFFLISIFLIIFIPIFRFFGENIFITLFIYFVSIVISQIINYFLVTKKDYNYLRIVSVIVIIISYLFFIYFAYKPPINWFFLNPTDNSYGLNK